MDRLPVTIKGIAESLLVTRPELGKHLAKAIDLLQGDRLRFNHHSSDGHPVYLATSSDGTKTYVVEAGACTCPARGLCYHRVARGLLTIRSANLTKIAWDEAIAEEEPPTAPQGEESAPPAEYVGPAYTPEEPVKRVQSAGYMRRGLTIRASMDRLGKRLVEVFTVRPVGAKLH